LRTLRIASNAKSVNSAMRHQSRFGVTANMTTAMTIAR
jgi:hypothetical protein